MARTLTPAEALAEAVAAYWQIRDGELLNKASFGVRSGDGEAYYELAFERRAGNTSNWANHKPDNARDIATICRAWNSEFEVTQKPRPSDG